jgi:hypothetical protein
MPVKVSMDDTADSGLHVYSRSLYPLQALHRLGFGNHLDFESTFTVSKCVIGIPTN